MTRALDKVRNQFGRFLIVLFWLHVPLLALVAYLVRGPVIGIALAGIALAAIYHMIWARYKTAPTTRYLSAVALMGEPALFVFLLSGDSWQMDMHMYFFAMLALTIAWCDRRVILLAAAAVALHHLALDYWLPMAVFPGGGDFKRVLLHAGIVSFQTAVLVWLSNMLSQTFSRIEIISDELVSKNIALKERTEEAEAASREKSMFLANMSHEIRTPMNAILGFCHLALRTELEPRQRDYVTKINNAGTSLLRLINDILDFSKNEAGKLSLEERPFDLKRAIDEQLNIAGMQAKAKGVALRSTFEGDVPNNLIGDELRFGQVLLNLVSNAVKFTGEGGVTVTVRAIERIDDRVKLEVFIDDTGIGMSQDQVQSLFAPFTQADNSTTRRFGGTGLGLAISKQIVESMGGSIRVESVPGHGSRFAFIIDLGIGTAPLRPVLSHLPASLANLRVLIADDNSGSREILEGIFEGWSISPELVASGFEVVGAVEAAIKENREYDLILLDWKMPGMDGLEAVSAMRNNENISKLPNIILVTAYGQDDFRAASDVHDISGCLLKPIDPQTLLAMVVELFADKQIETKEDVVATVPVVQEEFKGLRVLLAEDNDINREIATELLIDAGLKVDIAENGQIALDKVVAADGNYAAILMDVQMPELDGVEATVQIRTKWSSETLPIIALTAHAYEAERQRCFNAGMNDHIAKPVNPANLVQTLNKWLNPNSRDADVQNAVQSQPSAPAQILPDQLPPFDIPAALVRLNGKAPLLRKLIIDFGEKYGGTVESLKLMIAQGDNGGARALAHTLKGVAGSLELAELAKSCASIENTLMQGELEGVHSKIDHLQNALTPAIEAARSLTMAKSAPVAAKVNIDPAIVAEATEALQTALQRRSLRARAAFEQFANAIGLSAEAADAHPVKIAIDKLDFDSALAALTSAQPAELEGVLS